jgi:FixJ family two-component response regulator
VNESSITSERPIVFVVDDDAAVREALDSLLRSARLRVQTFATAREFLKAARHHGPACVVLDIRLPDENGLQVQRELTAAGCSLPLIFITGHGDIPMSVQAMKGGAVEFLTKPFRDEDLLAAIRFALEKDSAQLKRQAELAELRARYNRLTPREREVLERVVKGMLNKQIAADLGTTEITVKIQRHNAIKKMQAQSVAELVRQVEKLGLGANVPTSPS